MKFGPIADILRVAVLQKFKTTKNIQIVLLCTGYEEIIENTD